MRAGGPLIGVVMVAVSSGAVWAQSAGASAVAIKDSPIYAKMDSSQDPIYTLPKGQAVVIGMVLFGDEVAWCAVTRPGEKKRLGYVSCEDLESDRSPQADSEAAAAPKPAPAPAPPPGPIRVREVEAPPIPVREVAPVDAQKLMAAANPAPPSPAETVAEPPAVETIPVPPVPVVPETKTVEPADVETGVDFFDLTLRRTGLLPQIQQFPRNTSVIAFLDKKRLSAVKSAAVLAAIQKHFQADRFRKSIEGQIARGYSPETMAALAEFTRSGEAKSAEQIVEAGFRPEAHQDLRAFADQLSKSLPSQERLLLIHRLSDAAPGVEIETATTFRLVRASADGINPLLPEALRFRKGDLDAALKKVAQAYQPVVRNARIVQYLFTFREIDDAELEKLVEFWESPTGKWLNGAVVAGFKEASEAISRDLTAEIRSTAKLPPRSQQGDSPDSSTAK